MTTSHFLTILTEAREIFRCTGLDREPDAKQVIDYIEARVKGAEKGKRLLDEYNEYRRLSSCWLDRGEDECYIIRMQRRLHARSRVFDPSD